jgi:RNA polymerase sigma-70 factor (ECF subfamily)
MDDFKKLFDNGVTFSSPNRYIDKMEPFGSFYQDYKKSLFDYLMRMTGNYHLASDIMQESFTRFLERYGSKRPNAALLFTIARNMFFDHFRRQRQGACLAEDPIDNSASQEDGLMVKQEYRRVLAALQELKTDEKDILTLAISDGLSYRDIAAITDISVENVKVKVHRARLKLKKTLQRKGES